MNDCHNIYLVIVPTCFDAQYFLIIDFCIDSVDNLLCIVLKNGGKKCI